jgi:serine/threonine-protein kinase
MTSSAFDRSPGTLVAGYRIERSLGHGGLGAVVLVRDADGAALALKLIDLGGSEGPELHRLFEREVAASRRLQHPGIVRIVDAGRTGDLAYIAMEFVAGGDLGQLRGARLPPLHRAVDIGVQVALALAHAHARDIVHRDVKPANILVDGDVVKLADFGLARLADLHRSRTGVLAGTPAYMSPEQLAEGEQDARADLYSLGVVLFELVAGRLPHESNSLGELLRQVSRVAAPPLRQLRPDTPPALSDLVVRLLAKNRRERPADALTLAHELQALRATLPVQSPPDP